MLKRIVVIVVLGVLLLGGQAAAHTNPANDPDDIRGALDLKRVNFGHDDEKIWVSWRSWEKFGAGPFHDGGYLDVMLNPLEGYYRAWVTVDHRGGRWVADVRILDADGWTSRKFPVKRPFPKIAKSRDPRSALPDSIQERLEWTASSALNGEPGPHTPGDYVPESGWRFHDLSTD